MITFQNKVTLNENADIPAVNKISASDINSIKSEINTTETKLNGVAGTILWENNSPVSSFTEQTIQLSSDNYDFLEFYFAYNNDDAIEYLNGFKTYMGNGLIANLRGYTSDASLRRKVEYIDTTHYKIYSAYSGNSTDNSCLIPIYVVGYKINE